MISLSGSKHSLSDYIFNDGFAPTVGRCSNKNSDSDMFLRSENQSSSRCVSVCLMCFCLKCKENVLVVAVILVTSQFSRGFLSPFPSTRFSRQSPTRFEETSWATPGRPGALWILLLTLTCDSRAQTSTGFGHPLW